MLCTPAVCSGGAEFKSRSGYRLFQFDFMGYSLSIQAHNGKLIYMTSPPLSHILSDSLFANNSYTFVFLRHDLLYLCQRNDTVMGSTADKSGFSSWLKQVFSPTASRRHWSPHLPPPHPNLICNCYWQRGVPHYESARCVAGTSTPLVPR